jgi:uncharacterized phage protein gp47/JayE
MEVHAYITSDDVNNGTDTAINDTEIFYVGVEVQSEGCLWVDGGGQPEGVVVTVSSLTRRLVGSALLQATRTRRSADIISSSL